MLTKRQTEEEKKVRNKVQRVQVYADLQKKV